MSRRNLSGTGVCVNSTVPVRLTNTGFFGSCSSVMDAVAAGACFQSDSLKAHASRCCPVNSMRVGIVTRSFGGGFATYGGGTWGAMPEMVTRKRRGWYRSAVTTAERTRVSCAKSASTTRESFASGRACGC